MKENSTCWKKYYVYTGVNSYNQTGKGDDRVMFFNKAPRYHNDRAEQQKPAVAESKAYTNDYRLSLMKHNQQCIVNRLINKIE